MGPLRLKGEDFGSAGSVSLDRVVRCVSVSEQSDESGTNPSIPRPPSPSMPRPDSRPGTRHQPSNPAYHRPSAPGPHRGSRGTYGAKRVVPRPEGPGEDGVLPGNRGCSGDGVPRCCASSQPGDDLNRGPGVLSVERTTCAGRRPLKGEDFAVEGSLVGQPRPSRSERERQRTRRRILHQPIDSPRKAVDTVFCRWSARLLRVGDP